MTTFRFRSKALYNCRKSWQGCRGGVYISMLRTQHKFDVLKLYTTQDRRNNEFCIRRQTVMRSRPRANNGKVIPKTLIDVASPPFRLHQAYPVILHQLPCSEDCTQSLLSSGALDYPDFFSIRERCFSGQCVLTANVASRHPDSRLGIPILHAEKKKKKKEKEKKIKTPVAESQMWHCAFNSCATGKNTGQAAAIAIP